MANSINTNAGALVALRNLNATNRELDRTQNKISTGMRVASALDDGGAFAVAQGLRADMKAIGAVNEQLAGVKGLLKVSIAAGESISNRLGDLKAVTEKLADGNVTGDARTQYENQFKAMYSEMKSFVQNAEFRKVSLVSASAADIKVVSNMKGDAYTVTKQNIDGMLGSFATAPSKASAAAMLTSIDTSLGSVGQAMNALSSDYNRIEAQITFNQAVSDATEEGLGAIVDADLAKESARLQALQIKQQLGGQALGIANQAPQSILGLFR